MQQEEKPTVQQPREVRYDSSGKKIITSARSRETESAILAINDKLDQLLGILSSTLPTRLGSELREAVAGSPETQRLIEVVSKELPDRIKKDSDQIVFEKAEMLSMVISTSIQHLNDAFKSYQESILKALESQTQAHEKTGEALIKINSLLAELHAAIAGGSMKKTPAAPVEPPPEKPAPQPPLSAPTYPPPSFGKPEEPGEEKPAPPEPPVTPEPKEEERSDLPGWLQAKRDDLDSSSGPQTPDSPSGVS
ncbi:MAG: hypothetical protein U9Q76_10565 [candidate division WOR-3 bacterium]|jgi:hypothetical protein|nr:hypothetical protein [candidate division WOR-3 bacterium]